MNDLQSALLLLAQVRRLGRAVREETARSLLRERGNGQVTRLLLAAETADLPGWHDRPESLADLRSGAAAERARKVLHQVEKVGATLLFRGTPEYPERLLDLEHPPLLLYVRGDASLLHAWERSVAMVGSRSPSQLGLRFARRSAAELAAAGLTIVSGLALGTDAAVHEGALEADGYTVAVLASGVDEFTPRANSDLGRRITETGAVLSEYPPGTQVKPWSFTDRNRLIAALASHVVILEAGVGSGTTITAEAAIELDRQVWVMPGRPGDPGTAGGLQLLDFEGVRVFRGSSALIGVIPAANADAVPLQSLGAELLELAHQIAGQLPCRFDQLPARLGLTDRVPVLLAGLNLLKLHRIIHEDAAGQLSLVTELPERQPVR